VSFDLVAWVRPIPPTAAAAEELLRRHYETGETVFEADPSLGSFRADLLSRYPALEDLGEDAKSIWAMTPAASDRLVELNLSWQAEDQALLTIVELARKHRVVLYDPQGPDVHSPLGIPRGPGTQSAAAPEGRPWFPILTVGGALLLGFVLVLLMVIASQAAK
jgi:hypothetical protein